MRSQYVAAVFAHVPIILNNIYHSVFEMASQGCSPTRRLKRLHAMALAAYALLFFIIDIHHS